MRTIKELKDAYASNAEMLVKHRVIYENLNQIDAQSSVGENVKKKINILEAVIDTLVWVANGESLST
jgi:predicted translin family RNA/ssDNA-binding protein